MLDPTVLDLHLPHLNQRQRGGFHDTRGLVRGDRIFIRRADGIHAIDAKTGRVLWRRPAPRWTWGWLEGSADSSDEDAEMTPPAVDLLDAGSMWAAPDASTLAVLWHENSKRLVLTGHHGDDGRERWRMPVEWIEPLLDGVTLDDADWKPESSHACLMPDAPVPVLAVQGGRMSRTELQQGWQTSVFAGHNCLRLLGPDPDHGEIRWKHEITDALVNLWSVHSFDGTWYAAGHLHRLDETTGIAVAVRADGVTAWNAGRDGKTAYLMDGPPGSFGVGVMDRRGTSTEERFKRSRKPGAAQVYMTERGPLMDNSGVKLSRPGAWDVKLAAYVYGLGVVKDGPVIVATAGKGGGLQVFDWEAGKELLCFTPPSGGVHPSAFMKGQLLAQVPTNAKQTEFGLLQLDTHTLQYRVLPMRLHPIAWSDQLLVGTEIQRRSAPEPAFDIIRILRFDGP